MNSRFNYPIIHIGLGKTATTSLQQNVFSHIPNIRPEVAYNDKPLISQIMNRNLMSTKEEKKFKSSVNTGKHFISKESLVDWNPRNWKKAADQNLRLFGSQSTIIITVRDTEDYLCSLYQQTIHEGNILNAKDFFFNNKDYNKDSQCSSSSILTKFDVDSFDLELLVQIYKERFSKVIVVPLKTIKELIFLKEIFALNESEIELLKSKLHTGIIFNRAYSKKAMALTMIREKLLSYFSLSFYGNTSIEIKKKGNIRIKQPKLNPIYQLKNLVQSSGLLQCFLKRIANELRWRNFLQNRFDKIFTYEKYTLPKNIYRNEGLAIRNDNFIKSLSYSDKNSQDTIL